MVKSTEKKPLRTHPLPRKITLSITSWNITQYIPALFPISASKSRTTLKAHKDWTNCCGWILWRQSSFVINKVSNSYQRSKYPFIFVLFSNHSLRIETLPVFSNGSIAQPIFKGTEDGRRYRSTPRPSAYVFAIKRPWRTSGRHRHSTIPRDQPLHLSASIGCLRRSVFRQKLCTRSGVGCSVSHQG